MDTDPPPPPSTTAGPSSPGCAVERGAGGSAWWAGPAPFPAAPAASAAPGSAGAAPACGRDGGQHNGARPGPAPRSAPPPVPVLLQRVVHRPAGARGPSAPGPAPGGGDAPPARRSPAAAPGLAGPRGARRGVPVFGLRQARGDPVAPLPPLQELGRLQQHLDAGGRALHGCGRRGRWRRGRAGRRERPLAARGPAGLTSARRGNNFGRESSCFKFESERGGATPTSCKPRPSAVGHAHLRPGHAPSQRASARLSRACAAGASVRASAARVRNGTCVCTERACALNGRGSHVRACTWTHGAAGTAVPLGVRCAPLAAPAGPVPTCTHTSAAVLRVLPPSPAQRSARPTRLSSISLLRSLRCRSPPRPGPRRPPGSAVT